MRIRVEALAGLALAAAALGCADAVAEPIQAASLRADGGEPRGAAGGTAVGVPDGEHCADAADWPGEFEAAELALFEAINARRAEGIRCGDDEDREARRRGPLALVPELTCSARLHSLDMFENDYLRRENQDGDDFRDRIRAAGLAFETADEAITRSDAPPERVLDQLLDDWDDCGTLLNSELEGVGIGHYEGLWTLDFADI